MEKNQALGCAGVGAGVRAGKRRGTAKTCAADSAARRKRSPAASGLPAAWPVQDCADSTLKRHALRGVLPGSCSRTLYSGCSWIFRIQTIATVVKSVRFENCDFLNSVQSRLVNLFCRLKNRPKNRMN